MLEKALRLLSLLEALLQHPSLKGRLALKGGTAINLFLFDVPRLSVDIDLNYVGAAERDAMIADRPKVEQAARAVFEREGLRVRRSPKTDEHAGGKWLLRYASALGGAANLEVDLNFMFRVPLWKLRSLRSRQLGSVRINSVPVVDYHELAAGKLAALFSREASRDLFDAHELLLSNDLDLGTLRPAFVAYGAMNRKDWRTIKIDDIAFNARELKNELLPMLRTDLAAQLGNPKPWAQKLISECAERLEPLIAFTSAEREFLDRLLDHAEIKPELITTDEGLAERIGQHPLLAWKAENVRKHRKN
jgi:predicted nucleotidyltransferase component of viral defense system